MITNPTVGQSVRAIGFWKGYGVGVIDEVRAHPNIADGIFPLIVRFARQSWLPLALDEVAPIDDDDQARREAYADKYL